MCFNSSISVLMNLTCSFKGSIVMELGEDSMSALAKGIKGHDDPKVEMDDKEKDCLEVFGKQIKIGVVDEQTRRIKDASNFPKDVVDEWPAPKEIHTFYFAKYRSYEDPKLKAKIEQADKEIQRKNQARFLITEALREKRSDRSLVISQLKPLTADNKYYREIIDGKRKEMEPLHDALGKLRSANNAVREKGTSLCSSEEELNNLIKSLHYRMQHESLTLNEEKQLLKEIKQLEKTRETVIANASMRAKIQDSLGQRESIQGQVKLIGGDIDTVRKEQQEVRKKIKHMEDKLKVIDHEIDALLVELTAVNEKRNKAYENLLELRNMRDEVNACYFQNRSLLNNARNLSAKKDIAALRELSKNEIENFLLKWSRNRAFRDDYERRILLSLDKRQLSRDARMRNPDERSIVSEEPAHMESEATPAKVTVKQVQEKISPVVQDDTMRHTGKDDGFAKSTETGSTTRHTGKDDGLAKSRGTGSSTRHTGKDDGFAISTEAGPRGKPGDPVAADDSYTSEISEKESVDLQEADTAKLKEMKKEEEIAKAKLALERKKKQAEKAAAKAAIRAEKEAERKLKEKEKKARKKAEASATASSAVQTDTDLKDVYLEPEHTNADVPVQEKVDVKKENIKYRSRPKGQGRTAKVMIKKKKSHSYWVWGASAAAASVTLLFVGYYFSFVRN
ncbi:proton pump-interactor 1-like isoform X1 [Typha latifolia]|uniref:proton pump-interactor 1-like isoform X1 n=2 Tax=Typha latifolia TaxID=4733 RepID=UPI003C2D229E